MTDTKKEENAKQLMLVCGQVDRPVHELLLALVRQHPAVVWREPVPTRQRLDGFVGLWCGDLDQLAGNHPEAALDEARLFWQGPDVPAGCLHLVADVYGQAGCTRTRWAAFWEPADRHRSPGWLDEQFLGLHQDKRSLAIDLTVVENVLTMAARDRQRYGIGAVCRPADIKLKVHKYFSGTELVYWRLAR